MSIKTESQVYVVDDDKGIRIAMAALMDSVGLDCQTFASADQCGYSPTDVPTRSGTQ